MHSIESRFVIGPSSVLFGGVYVCTFQPENFTGCGSEGVNPRAEDWSECHVQESIPSLPWDQEAACSDVQGSTVQALLSVSLSLCVSLSLSLSVSLSRSLAWSLETNNPEQGEQFTVDSACFF